MVTRENLNICFRGVMKSYSQVFFSENMGLAAALLLVSFLDVSAGMSGLLSVLSAQVAATLLHFDRKKVSDGLFGFNSLLAGLGLGYFYQLTPLIALIAILTGFLTFIATVTIQGILSAHYLPALSLPFVLSAWIVFSGATHLSGTEINDSGVFLLNKLFTLGGHPLVNMHKWWLENISSDFLNSWFLSLGAIFFQFNVFSGLIIALALLFYSRITFLLSLLGFAVAWSAYRIFGMDMNQLGYTFIGFNFILTAIALGGYFYIPSAASFLWAIAITPVVALTAAGISGLLKPFNLALLSLPFNITVIVFIYSLRFRIKNKWFREVPVQNGSPERNLYACESHSARFPYFGMLNIKLPFYGEWTVSQGHDGNITHCGEWSQAWDFTITDNQGKQFSNRGSTVFDYYCFGQSILAPASGVIAETEDGIEDNLPGEVNTVKNWGNTVIIRHSEGLYSKLSHLKMGSVCVKTGDIVREGQQVGKAGNSGRSPFPHLHFQIQSTPYIGATTTKYPLSAYIENNKSLVTFGYPPEGARVKPAEKITLTDTTFRLTPGTAMIWKSNKEDVKKEHAWEVISDNYNNTYISCRASRSKAYFRNDGLHFFFTHFEGNKKTLLYSFYLAAFRLSLVHYAGGKVSDSLPANITFSGLRLFIHDFIAPFTMFLKTEYMSSLTVRGPEFDPDSLEYNSAIRGLSLGKEVFKRDFRLTITRKGMTIEDRSTSEIFTCEPY